MKAEIPLGRFGKPIEVADLTLFLASSASDMITGETIYSTAGSRRCSDSRPSDLNSHGKLEFVRAFRDARSGSDVQLAARRAGRSAGSFRIFVGAVGSVS